jgi:hypothetical protein
MLKNRKAREMNEILLVQLYDRLEEIVRQFTPRFVRCGDCAAWVDRENTAYAGGVCRRRSLTIENWTITGPGDGCFDGIPKE